MPRLGNEDGINETVIEDWCIKNYGSLDEYIAGGGCEWWDFCADCADDLEGEPVAEYLHVVGQRLRMNPDTGKAEWGPLFTEPCGTFVDRGEHPDYEGELWKDDDGELQSDYRCQCCDEVLRGSDY
jgi:hypothetical protein